MAPNMLARAVPPARPRRVGPGPSGRRLLGVGPVAAQHEGVVPDLGDQAVRHLVGQCRHPDLAEEVVRRTVGQLVKRRAMTLGVEVRRPVDVQEEARHPTRRQLDHAETERGNRSSTPVRMRLARGDRRAPYRKISGQLLALLLFPRPPGRVQGALEVRDMEHRGNAFVAERRPHTVEIRVRKGLPVNRSRGDHGQAYALRPYPPDLLHRPGRVVQQHMGHPEESDPCHHCTRPPRSGCKPARWRVAGAVRGQSLFPQEAVVREQDRCVEPERVERRQAGTGQTVGVRDQLLERCRSPLATEAPHAVLPDQYRTLRDRDLRAGSASHPAT